MNPRSDQVGRVIGKHKAFVDGDGSWSWFFQQEQHPPQSLNFQVRSGPEVLGTNVPIPLNEWTHVAVTFDDATKQFAIYVNGVQVAHETADLDIHNTTRDLYIGSEEDVTFFDGLLDEVSLYNRALSAAEIAAIASAGSAGKCKAGRPVVVNDLVTLSPVGTVFDPTPVAGGPAGTFTIAATFKNTSSSSIDDPVFKVTQLSGGNLLLDADGAPGGPGAHLTPDVGADGILVPGESFTTRFVIGLQHRSQFTFFVDLWGEPSP